MCSSSLYHSCKRPQRPLWLDLGKYFLRHIFSGKQVHQCNFQLGYFLLNPLDFHKCEPLIVQSCPQSIVPIVQSKVIKFFFNGAKNLNTSILGVTFYIYIVPLCFYLYLCLNLYGSIGVSFFPEFCKKCQYYFERGFFEFVNLFHSTEISTVFIYVICVLLVGLCYY